MIGDSEGMQYADAYEFAAYHADQMDTFSGNAPSSGMLDDNSNTYSSSSLFGKPLSFNERFDAATADIQQTQDTTDLIKKTRTLGDQMDFLLHPGQDIVEHDGSNRPHMDVDKGMLNFATDEEKRLGKGDQGNVRTPREAHTFHPSPFNDIQNAQQQLLEDLPSSGENL